MAEQVRIRRDSDDIASTHTGVAGELGYNTTDGTIHAYDGVTPGGKKTLMAEDGIALALIDPIPANTVLGNPTGSSGPVTTIAISSLGGGGAPTVNADSIYGNNTGSAAPGTSLSVAQAKALLGFASTAELTAGLAGKANETVNIAAGSGLSGGGNLDASMSIELASIPANSLIANFTGAAAIPVDHTLASLVTKIPVAVAGTPGLMPALPATPTGKVLDDSNNWVTGGGGGLATTDVPTAIRGAFASATHGLDVRPVAAIGNLLWDVDADRQALEASGYELLVRDRGGASPLVRNFGYDHIRHRRFAWVTYGSIQTEPGSPTFSTGGVLTTSLFPTVTGSYNNFNSGVFGSRLSNTAASAQNAYLFTSMPVAAMPPAGGGRNGFLFRARIQPRDGAVNTNGRWFVGLVEQDLRVTNVDYSTYRNHIGFMRKPGSDNIWISSRGPAAGGIVNQVDTGFAANGIDTTAGTATYMLSVYCPRNKPGKAYFVVEREDVPSVFQQVQSLTVGLDMPGPDTGLVPVVAINNGTGNSSVIGLSFAGMEIITHV